MDDEAFDGIARSLIGARSRRSVVVALAGCLGFQGPVGLDVALADNGKCHTFCDECAPCKKGTCKKVNGRVHCSKGKCKPKPNDTPCSGGTCQNGSCVAPFPPPPPYCAGKNFCPI